MSVLHFRRSIHLNPRVAILPANDARGRTVERVVLACMVDRFRFEIDCKMVPLRGHGSVPKLAWIVRRLIVAVRTDDLIVSLVYFGYFSQAIAVIRVEIPTLHVQS